jgi:hypothetical protein
MALVIGMSRRTDLSGFGTDPVVIDPIGDGDDDDD